MSDPWLQPGERELWRGRLAVGASWPSFGRLALFTAGAWAALVAPLLLVFAGCRMIAAPWPSPQDVLRMVAFVGALVGAPTAVLALSKVVGPSYFRLFCLLLVTPEFVGKWLTQVERHGWAGALERQSLAKLLAPAVFVGLPALSVVWTLLARLDAACVVTDRRLIELNGSGQVARACAFTPGGNDDLRVERTWRAPGGLLCAGLPCSPFRMAVALRDDHPVEVIAQVRRLGRGA